MNKNSKDSRRFRLISSHDEKSNWSVEIETWLQLSSEAMKAYSEKADSKNDSFSDSNQYARHVASVLLKDCARNTLRSESSRIDLLKSSRPFRFADGMMRVTCTCTFVFEIARNLVSIALHTHNRTAGTSSSNSAAACRVMDETSLTKWSASARLDTVDEFVLETSASSYSGHLLWSKPPNTFRIEVSSDKESLATVWCLDTGCGSVLYVLICHKYSNINPLVISNRICNKSARIRTPNSRSNTGTNGGWTIVDGVSNLPRTVGATCQDLMSEQRTIFRIRIDSCLSHGCALIFET